MGIASASFPETLIRTENSVNVILSHEKRQISSMQDFEALLLADHDPFIPSLGAFARLGCIPSIMSGLSYYLSGLLESLN